jgi:glycine hydroxymethyltransferase
VIFTDNVISVANYSLVDKKFNYSWGGTYSLNKKNIQLSYEWHSQDSLLVNTTAELSLVLKKNGKLSIGKLLSDFKRLDDSVSGDLFGAWIISGNYLNDVVSRRANPFLPRRTMKIISGKYFQPFFYGVEQETGLIDWNKVEETAHRERPKMIICGASAYSRDWDYTRLRQIADSIGAILLADISHPAGLIAKGLLNDPFDHCHIVTTTTHKTLRGTRGGVIMMRNDFPNPFGITTQKGETRMMSSLLDSGVFPGTQGGPLEHIIAAKAISFGEALTEGFYNYQVQVQKNAKVMAQEFMNRGYKVISGGTDNHLMLIDLRPKNLTGKIAENSLIQADITVNKNMVPFDDKSAITTSGMRVGTSAMTTRGLIETDMVRIVDLIDEVLMNHDNTSKITNVRSEINNWMKNYPLFQY